MPELPEVECVRQGILEKFQGKQIQNIWHDSLPNLLLPQSLPLQFLKGQNLQEIQRKGKYLRLDFEQYHLFAHLGMSGVWEESCDRKKHTHLQLLFSDKICLQYTDPRRFGFLALLPWGDSIAAWNKLGPDALSTQWTSKSLYQKIAHRHQEIKVLLLDQEVVAGIGNIYASECLFLSGVHPQRKGQSITYAECVLIVKAAKKIMRLSIKNRGTTFSDYRLTNGKGGSFQGFLKVFQKLGEACPQCHAPIQGITQAGRSTFYCPKCQAR